MLATGHARLERVLARFADRRLSPFSAAAVVLGIDRWDVAAGAGRIARLELRAPRLGISLRRKIPPLLTSVLHLFAAERIVLRRIRIVDGQLTLDSRKGAVTLRGVNVALQAHERLAGAGFVVSARAGVAPDGRLAVEGSLSRDLRRAEGALRAGDVAVNDCTVLDVTVPLPPRPTLEALTAALAATCATPL